MMAAISRAGARRMSRTSLQSQLRRPRASFDARAPPFRAHLPKRQSLARARRPPFSASASAERPAQDLLGKTVVVVGLGYVPTSVSRAFKRVRRARAGLLSTLPTVANPPTP